MKDRLILVAITGTPATGKSTLAKRIAKSTGCRMIEINDVVERKKLFSSKDKYGSKIVRLPELETEVKREIRSQKGMVLLVGHLAPELRFSYDIAVVTRAPLKELVKRMKKRGYPIGKMKENLMSEALDYCGSVIKGMSKETYEVSTKSESELVIKYLKHVSEGKKSKKPAHNYVERVRELEGLIKEGWTF